MHDAVDVAFFHKHGHLEDDFDQNKCLIELCGYCVHMAIDLFIHCICLGFKSFRPSANVNGEFTINLIMTYCEFLLC